DPTGQSPEDAWNWFNNNILSWEGLPYLDIGIAGLGVAAATVASGGTMTVPVAVALFGLAATVPSAADQVVAHSTGEGFMDPTLRTVANVASMVGSGVDAGIGIVQGYKHVKRITALQELKTSIFRSAKVQLPLDKTTYPLKMNVSDSLGVRFRADSRPVDEIFANGFDPRGTNMNLLRHQKGGAVQRESGFVSTSKDPKASVQFALGSHIESVDDGVAAPGMVNQAGNIYVAHGAPGGINVNKTLGKSSLFPDQQEIAYAGGIRPNNIVGAYTFQPDLRAWTWNSNPGYGTPFTPPIMPERLSVDRILTPEQIARIYD
ncbi:enterotoxin A family protein, partial [Streptomyces cyaneofuscatus]|uniref:scabin-related ADP-ribosyltransferase n=1 Tax=Streptomyces cyaneofuscatus TaxID=66883 RepID=UPI0038098656